MGEVNLDEFFCPNETCPWDAYKNALVEVYSVEEQPEYKGQGRLPNPKKVQCALNSHWLDGRVKAHIFICYLSYLLMKTVEHMLKKGGLGGRLNVEIVHPLTDTKSNYGCAGDRVYKV